MSWCIPSPSSWAGTAPRWAARSSTAASFRGKTTPSALRCSASPTPPITGSSMSIGSAPPPMSRAAAASISAPPARCWRRLSAFLLLQGIETVALRVERHVENARRVAEFLRHDARVAWVNYVGFADSPYHALARKYLGGRACSLLTFGVKGGYAGRNPVLRRAQARQAPGQHRRREVARLPSGLHDPSPDVGRRSRSWRGCGRRRSG